MRTETKDTRAAIDTRTASRRDDGQRGPNIRPQDIPAGMVWKWAREKALGARDEMNMSDNQFNGWVPVDGRKYPHLLPPLYPGQERTDTAIRHGANILLERAKELCDEDQAELDQLNAQALESVDSDRRGEAIVNDSRSINTRARGTTTRMKE